MERKKRFLLQLFLLIVILILIKTSSALGVTPAKIEVNFEQGLERTIEYSVFEEDPKQELEIYVDGDLSEYVKLDKDKLVGSGKFTAILKLPENVEKPGRHQIVVGVKEKIDEELYGTAVGTSVTIRAIIIIHVPYPGKYLDINLESNNVNVGEPVDFKLTLISKGKENINMTPKIEIMSKDDLIETLYFKNREIKSQETLKLTKSLDTTNYNPGKYTAIAIVDYGTIAKAESKFKIGELIIYIMNYTKQIIINKIESFDIEIESGWNNQIDGAYAEVFFFNGSKPLISFKTSSTELTPWERKIITGFFDASNFTEGFYDANITLVYYGKEVGKSSSEIVKVEFIKQTNLILIAMIVSGILLVVVIVFLIKKYSKK